VYTLSCDYALKLLDRHRRILAEHHIHRALYSLILLSLSLIDGVLETTALALWSLESQLIMYLALYKIMSLRQIRVEHMVIVCHNTVR